jgi:hypothetical protein
MFILENKMYFEVKFRGNLYISGIRHDLVLPP